MPAITRLMMARDYSGMPVDFMECWITVLWSLDAIERLLADRPKERQFLKYIPELRRRVVALLGLSRRVGWVARRRGARRARSFGRAEARPCPVTRPKVRPVSIRPTTITS
jgi:hypothetical protein